MNEWYSASTLAAMDLPEIPVTKSGVRKKAVRENWRCKPSSNGVDYHISALPVATQVALAAREVNINPEAVNGEYAASLLMREDSNPANFTLSTRLDAGDARLWIVDAVNRLKARTGCTYEQAIQAYNSGQLEGPEWVREHFSGTNIKTFEAWQTKLRKGGLKALKNQHGNRRGQNLIDTQPDLRAFILGMLTMHPHIKNTLLHEAAVARFRMVGSMNIPSPSSIGRWVTKWKAANQATFQAITNPDDYKNRFMTAFGDADGDIVRMNQRWEIDSTPADILCTDGRYCLIGIMDIYSRRMMILVAPTSKAEAVCLALRKAILAWGVPELLLTDNGKDYISRHVLRVLYMLGIEHDNTDPFAGWQKPFVERCFRSISHDVFELAPGFIGHNVSERSAIEARKSFSDRLFKKDNVIEAKMTGVELQTLCDEWCENRHGRRYHSELKCSPFDMVTNWTAPVRRIDDERALDLLLAKAPGNNGLRTIGKKGITHDNAHFIAAELALHMGEQVMCLCDPQDLGRLYVFRENDDGEFERLCVAECAERLGFNPQEVAAQARALQTKHVQEKKRELKALARQYNTKDILDEIRAKDREAQGVVAWPGRSVPHETSALTAASEHVNSGAETAQAPIDQSSRDNREAAAALIAKRNTVTTLEETPRQRYRRWLGVDKSISEGADVSADDREFHRSYQTHVEWECEHLLASGKFSGIHQATKSPA